MPEHSTLTDPSLHEPKGVASATINKHYCSDGAGSGTWQKVKSSEIDTATIKNTNKGMFAVQLADVSTADFVLVPFPQAATFDRATIILKNAITSADSTLTFTNITGPTTIGIKVITYSGSVEGTRFVFVPSSGNEMTAGSYLKIATDGASSTSCLIIIIVEYTLT